MTPGAKVRALIACCALALCFTGFSARLIELQVTEHDKYLALADEKHGNKEIIPARRGLIVDINQQPLADNDPVRTVVADASVIADVDDAAAVLAGPLGLDQEDVRAKLATGRRYIVLKKDVPDALAREIENRLEVRSIRGINFLQDQERIYPNGAMGCHIVGFMNGEHAGVQGIEYEEDQYLRGHDGYRYIERDRTGQELVAYRGEERQPRNGYTVRLTVDMNLQNIVETELDAACAEFKPKKAIVILMKPQTGEILAMANRPNFDPNDVRTKPASYIEEHQGDMKNCAISDMMEPGSTFKMVTAAGALNEHLVTPDSMIFCENGEYNYGGRILHDHHPYGDLSVEDILVKSSNIGAAKLGMELGPPRLYGYIRGFGFGERTGVALPGEIGGLVYPPHKWSKLSITRIPMGQEVAVTPLQTITAMSAIANGGHLMMPQIVHDILDENGVAIAKFPPVEIRQVVSDESARQVTNALKGVVSVKGTAALARVSGFVVAGKTGTAEKIDPKGGYMPGKYIVSFCGYLPADKPAFICLVMLDDAQTKPDQDYGGMVAGPVFSRIGEKVARYMNLEPAAEDATATMVQAQSEREIEHD
jgi:cell division protein FtsI (penicillin-binding protein 3)/stage V sporulation protein D (sporulation-specific penicillin-binding protein)